MSAGFTIHDSSSAPPEERARVDFYEAGKFAGGLVGAELGAGAGVALAGFASSSYWLVKYNA
jgi:hypothetical protein